MTAPIPPPALRSVLEPFGQSLTLPAEAYVSASVYEWEQQHFLAENWVCVGRSSDLPGPGAQLGVALAGTRALVLRDLDGTVRAFFNVCRHRGHELIGVPESREADVVMCPYHGWVYGLDGALRATRHCDEQEFAREDHGLLALAAGEWHGWLFVNTSGSAVDLATYVGSRLAAG